MVSEDLDTIKGEAKRRIRVLVEDYMRVLASDRRDTFNERRLKIAFTDPLFNALGWNVNTDRIDCELGLDGKSKLFVKVKSFNESLDGNEAVKGNIKELAEDAIEQAWNVGAEWTILTNFDETRLYYSHVRKPKDGLIWKIRFTEYDLRFDELWLLSKTSVISGALNAYKAKVERPREDERIIEFLKREGPSTRRQIIEKLGLSPSFIFPPYILRFGSRRRKVYYLDGQQEVAKEIYENMLKPPPKPPKLPYYKGYFLRILNLETPSAFPYRSPAGTPKWWERRANRQYTCSSCARIIEKGERYIGCRKLSPGHPGIYGWKGTYRMYYFHIKCLLIEREAEIVKEIRASNLKIKGLQKEIVDLKKQIPIRKTQIKAHRAEIKRTREEYEKAHFWRKLDRWINYHYTSWSRSRAISRLEAGIVLIENKEVPVRRSEIAALEGKINMLETRLSEIRTRIEELITLSVKNTLKA